MSRIGWYNDKTILKKIKPVHWTFRDTERNTLDIDLILTTNVPSATTVITNHVKSTCKLPPSTLKSAIQKSIRRGETRRALKCSAELMRRSRHEKGGGKNQFLDLVRRVIIIAIEDVVLHPDLPVLAWIMAACSKGFRASEVHFHFVLRVVRDLANSTYREPCIRDDEDEEVRRGSYEEIDHEISKLLVRSLLLRKEFGGMKGDMRMLENAARVWSGRLKGCHNDMVLRDLFPLSDMMSDELKSVLRNPLLEADVNTAAVDFHCAPRIALDVLSETNQSLDREDDFRSAMWYYRSGINRKRIVRLFLMRKTGKVKTQNERNVDEDNANSDISLKSFWNSLEHNVEAYSRNVISNGFRR